MNLRILCPLLLVCTHLSSPGSEGWKSRFTDGPSAGVLTGGDLDQSRPAFGWQAGFDVNRPVSLDLACLFWEDEIPSSTLAPLGLPAGGKVNLDNTSISLSARYHFIRRETWSSYLGGGASYFLSNEEDKQLNRTIASAGLRSPSDADVELQDGFAPHLLAGAEVSLARHWEVFGEARLVMADYDLETRLVSTLDDGRKVSAKSRESYGYDHALFRIGLNYRF